MNETAELNIAGKAQTPLVMASSAAESALACLVMLSRRYGHLTDLNGLRQRLAYSALGVPIGRLIALLGELGFSARVIEEDAASIARIQTPAILRWTAGYFVVLVSVSGGKFTIHDPVRGKRRLTFSEFERHYDRLAIEASPAADFAILDARAGITVTHLWSRIHGVGGTAVQVLALSFVLQLAYFAAPFNIQLVVDQVLANGDRDLLTVLAVGFGLLAIFQAFSEVLRSWSLQIIASQLSFQLVGNLVRHLLRLPPDYFERRHVGDILSRIGSATAIQDALSRGLIASLVDGTIALIAVVLMFTYSPKLTVVVLGFLVVSLLIALAFYPRSRALQQERILASAQEQTFLMETVRAASIIKLMGRGAEREGAWRNHFAAVTNAALGAAKVQIGASSLQALAAALQSVTVIYLGVLLILDAQGFSVGMLLAFLAFRQTLTDRTNALINQALQFRLLGLHLDRLSDIVTATPETTVAAPQAEPMTGSMEMRSVSFRYERGGPPLLQDVDLVVRPREFLAVTGPSGSGKTTLLKLLQGVLTPTGGDILVDGHVATPERWSSWRSQIAVVSQDDRLLSGTIAENIAFFDPDFDLNRVAEAAKSACIHDDIALMALGYLSPIGDMGAALSGGQKQRLLLARALYRSPKILLLDEGTAHLDEDTEDQIAELILSLPITRVVVAHRPALVQRADRVAVLAGGRLTFPRSQRSFVVGDL